MESAPKSEIILDNTDFISMFEFTRIAKAMMNVKMRLATGGSIINTSILRTLLPIEYCHSPVTTAYNGKATNGTQKSAEDNASDI